MKFKVCGLRDMKNIREVVELSPDFIGFIFHESSLRFVSDLSPADVKQITGPKKVGVFVNQSVMEIMKAVDIYGLDLAQLHGDQSAEEVDELVSKGIKVMKVFRVIDELPLNLRDYTKATYYLFDTLSEAYGGTGETFDWSILAGVDHPFMLSGGIDLEHIEQIKSFENPYLIGIDVNSRFELAPGSKDISKIKQLKEAL